jgi:hypothetical protein
MSALSGLYAATTPSASARISQVIGASLKVAQALQQPEQTAVLAATNFAVDIAETVAGTVLEIGLPVAVLGLVAISSYEVYTHRRSKAVGN